MPMARSCCVHTPPASARGPVSQASGNGKRGRASTVAAGLGLGVGAGVRVEAAAELGDFGAAADSVARSAEVTAAPVLLIAHGGIVDVPAAEARGVITERVWRKIGCQLGNRTSERSLARERTGVGAESLAGVQGRIAEVGSERAPAHRQTNRAVSGYRPVLVSPEGL